MKYPYLIGFVGAGFLAALALAEPLIAPMGATNPNVTQSNIHETICIPGWSATIRPPQSYTAALKQTQLRTYSDKNPSHYEEDHLIPLSIGGHPTDPANLWPQPWPEARLKDELELKLHRLVCAGLVSLADAQHMIATDWRAAYRQFIKPLPLSNN